MMSNEVDTTGYVLAVTVEFQALFAGNEINDTMLHLIPGMEFSGKQLTGIITGHTIRRFDRKH